MRKIQCVVFLTLLGFCVTRSLASTGTSGASFLEIPVGAGPAAMGGAYSALASDAYSPTWNPGGLGFLESNQLAGQHLSYLESMSYEYASFVHPLKAGRSLGVSAQYFTTGDIPGTDPSGTSTGDFSSHYGAYTAAYGQKFGDHLALGLSTKWINAKIDNVSSDAFAADLGALYKASEKLSLAATLLNLGSSLKFIDQSDPLPLEFHLGAAYRLISSVLLSGEGVYTREGRGSFHAGGEWRPLDLIGLRVGYRTDTLKELSPLAGFSTGIGLNIWGQEFAYAWLPYDDLGNTHYFSLLMRFGEAEAQKKRNLIQYQSIRTHSSAENLQATTPEYEQMMELLQKNDPRVSDRPEPKPKDSL